MSDQALWESHSSLLIHYYDAASLVTFFFSLYLFVFRLIYCLLATGVLAKGI